MFVGEAPGRLGADGSGIPFHGDRAGDNFEDLLEFVGLSRGQIFVTNAVLCNPKDEQGNNASPTRGEIGRCASFLREQIDLLDPAIVVSLGGVALRALNAVCGHNLRLREHVRTAHQWYGRRLIPLYHPGQRAMIHRSMANQRSDYQFVVEQLRKGHQVTESVAGVTNVTVASVVANIIEEIGTVGYFALHKIVYLLEYAHVKRNGTRLTGAYFIRQKDGPYCTDLQIRRLKRALNSLRIERSGGELMLHIAERDLFKDVEIYGRKRVASLMDDEMRALVRKFGCLSKAELKRRAYLTRPMREVLRREQSGGVNMYNLPIRVESRAVKEG